MARGPNLLTIGAVAVGAFWAAQRGYLGEGARKWAESLGVSLPGGSQGTDKPADPAQPPNAAPEMPSPEWRNWGSVDIGGDAGKIVAWRSVEYKGPAVSLRLECAAVQVVNGRDGPQREDWTVRRPFSVPASADWRQVYLSVEVPMNVPAGPPYRVWLAVKYSDGRDIKYDRYGRDLWLPYKLAG